MSVKSYNLQITIKDLLENKYKTYLDCCYVYLYNWQWIQSTDTDYWKLHEWSLFKLTRSVHH